MKRVSVSSITFLRPLLFLPLACSLVMAIALSAPQVLQAGEVNVYSYRQPFLIEPIFQRFQRETGIRVNVVFAPKGMVERLKAEGRNSPADMIFTVDIGRLNDAVEAGVLQGVKTPALLSAVPAPYRHPDGLWYALTLRSRAVFASRERVPAGTVTTYEDLASPRWKGRICSRSSQHVYNVALLASLIAHHGEREAERWALGLKNNLARRPQGNDRAQVKAIHAGECDVALVNTYYMGKMLNDGTQAAWAEAVYIAFPNQNGRGAHVNISGAGIARHAPNRKNAVRLLEFLTSEPIQRYYAEQNYEYPVRPNTPWSPLLESWGRFKADELSLDEIARNRVKAIILYDRVGFP